MFFEEVEASTKGVKALKHEHSPQLTLGLNFDENNGALNGKKK